jgi:hypothetical protein
MSVSNHSLAKTSLHLPCTEAGITEPGDTNDDSTLDPSCDAVLTYGDACVRDLDMAERMSHARGIAALVYELEEEAEGGVIYVLEMQHHIALPRYLGLALRVLSLDDYLVDLSLLDFALLVGTSKGVEACDFGAE